MEQGTNEWIEWRRQGIGASDIAPLVGVHRYSTPYQVWTEKVGLSTGFAGNFATQRGSELEAKARARYELVTMEDMPPALAVHPKWPMCRVSLDGLREDGRLILEIKCPGEEAHSIAKSGKVPEWYLPQVQYQLAVTGADELHYFSFGEDESDALVIVKPDVEYQGFLIQRAIDFWEHNVLKKIAPPLTEKDVKEVEPTGRIGDVVAALLSGKETLPKDQLDALKAKLVSLGGHNKVRSGRVLVSRSRTKAGKDSYRMTIAEEKAETA